MKNVTRIELTCLCALLAVLNLRHNFGRQEHFKDLVVEFLGLFELLDVLFHLPLLPGESVQREPLVTYRRSGSGIGFGVGHSVQLTHEVSSSTT